jgi:hypothetical protein
MDGEPGLKFATISAETVLRQTPGGRFEIKATFLEDDRSLQTLIIQRYSNKTGPLEKQHFSFVGAEIDNLLNFIAGVKSTALPGASKIHLSDEAVRQIVLDHGEARRIFNQNPGFFLKLAQDEALTQDLVAVGYRRRQLRRFEQLLSDQECFQAEIDRLDCTPERLWQEFFEANTWIFGYGLSYQFLANLEGRSLEQVVRGNDLTGAGKRTDALMKTRGAISSLCLIEIKRHDTELLCKSSYRADVWSPSPDLAGGIAQVQRTVYAAVETIGQTLVPTDDEGTPTSEVLFNIEPRSCLVVGSLAQFRTSSGFNMPKFRSFELFRRNTWRPEIITFDELLERAKFIVEHNAASQTPTDGSYEAQP